MTEGKRNIIRQLLEEYDIKTAEDIQDALKDLLGGTIKEMMEAEMMNILDMKSLNVLIMMITEMATKVNASTAAMVLRKLKCLKIVINIQPYTVKNLRRHIYPFTRKSSPCMPKE